MIAIQQKQLSMHNFNCQTGSPFEIIEVNILLISVGL